MKNLKNAFSRLPVIGDIAAERWRLHTEIKHLQSDLAQYKTWVPPGHFYSPVGAIDEIKKKEREIFSEPVNRIPAINLDEAEQVELIASFADFYRELPFPSLKTSNYRYFFENPNYSYSDAIVYYCMLRYARPNRIIEIGSGYSSCVALDTNDSFFQGGIECTFIEPYPELLLELLNVGDQERIQLHSKPLQDVDISVFSSLQENDILFIDSTHVSKVGSDVNYIFFQILPALSRGVYIHIHDIFFPFEYPKEWIYEGRAWNENYVLRAFLQYNEKFKIVFFNTFLEHFHADLFRQYLPLCLNNPGGSIWLQKL